MYNASLIAKWFLNHDRIINSSEDVGGISNLKLQKLLYYAQGVCLAINGTPLFGEQIFAWKHGPVVPGVYDEFKDFGSKPIDFNDDFDFTAVSLDDAKLLEEVFDVFGQYSAWKLRDMTHDEPPYRNTLVWSVIPNESIRDYFADRWVVD